MQATFIGFAFDAWIGFCGLRWLQSFALLVAGSGDTNWIQRPGGLSASFPTWDIEGRRTGFPIEDGKVIAHEFDFRTKGVIYEKNGVKVNAFPAIHILDGSVSFRLDWNGRSFVFGGDTYPNKWFIKHAKDAELVVHECFMTP